MLKHLAIALSGVLALGVAGCQRDDDAVVKKLDEISAKLDKLDDIENKIGSAGNAPAGARPTPQRPQAGRPDPNEVYAVPIDGSPFKGAKDAKVTIIEGFEFA